jgi:glycosyltransferase involved in cell wall biosynthesis
MALGRPVVTKRTPYMERFIEDGRTGFLYGRLAAAELADRLKRAASLAPAAAGKLGRAARTTVLKKASLDSFASLLADEFVP